MKFESWGGGVDPDRCYWIERGDFSKFFLNVIRIFYEAGPPVMEEIGIYFRVLFS